MRVFSNINDLRNAALFLIASIPILTFAVWMERSAVEKEIAAVSEKHLVVAKNRSAAIFRYVTGVGIVISLLENHKTQEDQLQSDSIHIRYCNYQYQQPSSNTCFVKIVKSSNAS